MSGGGKSRQAYTIYAAPGGCNEESDTLSSVIETSGLLDLPTELVFALDQEFEDPNFDLCTEEGNCEIDDRIRPEAHALILTSNNKFRDRDIGDYTPIDYSNPSSKRMVSDWELKLFLDTCRVIVKTPHKLLIAPTKYSLFFKFMAQIMGIFQPLTTESMDTMARRLNACLV